jgi:hypothetical protein
VDRLIDKAYSKKAPLEITYIYEGAQMTDRDRKDIAGAVTKRLDHIVSKLQPVRNGMVPVELILANDFGEDLNNPESPLQRAHGSDWFVWLYTEFLSRLALANKGKSPESQVILGRDIRPAFSTFDIERPNGAQMSATMTFLQRFREVLPQQVAALPAETQQLINEQGHQPVLDAGFTMHLSGEDKAAFDKPLPPTAQELTDAMNMLIQVDPANTGVIVRELDVYFKTPTTQGPNQAKREAILRDIYAAYGRWGRNHQANRRYIQNYNALPDPQADPASQYDWGDQGFIDPVSFKPTESQVNLAKAVDQALQA